MYVYIYIYTYIYICVCVYVYITIYIYIYMHTYTHIIIIHYRLYTSMTLYCRPRSPGAPIETRIIMQTYPIPSYAIMV